MLNVPSLEKYSIRTGCIVDENMLLLLLEDIALADEGLPYSGLAFWLRDKDWHLSRIDYDGISVKVISGSPTSRKTIVVGDSGDFSELMKGKVRHGAIKDGKGIASVKNIRDSVIAVGVLGKVFQMSDSGEWDDLRDMLIKENLESCCEYPLGGFLVCGWQGAVAHYNSGVVEKVDAGTNVILTDIVCDDDGGIFACGQKGTIVCGQKNALKPLELTGIMDDFWSIAKFKGEIYVSSTTALYRLVNDETLELVKVHGDEIPISFYHLDTYEDSLMLSVGQKDAVLFDGKNWTRIL